MLASVRPLAALMLGVALLLSGSGLLGPLLALRGGHEGFSDQAIGLVMSAYFAGFFLGTFAAPGLIRRIGHIRAFAFYAALCTVSVLLHPMLVDPWAWALLRLATGIALVGLYTVIESWLNVQALPAQRGRVFAIYMVINLLALAAGPWLLPLAARDDDRLFSLVAMLICAAALPVTASRMAQPVLPDMPQLDLRALYHAAPAATAGALLAGLAMGAFWGLAAIYALRVGFDTVGMAALVSLTILGGAALQWPLGRWSDQRDRRSALAVVATVAALLALLMLPGAQLPKPALLALWFAFGGMAFALYPLCIAHLLDHLPGEDTLSACASLLLLNGIGSAIGPALAGLAMGQWGANALPAYLAGTLLLLAAVATSRRLLRYRETDQPSHYHPMLRTTPAAFELLPETGDSADTPQPQNKDTH
ncbi:MAG TPA: MFS transporter [Arenimonas sp.]|nr:MFS transporter [Arenimonas sp.]